MKKVDYNNCDIHRYKVPIVGGLMPFYEVFAPNKTMARYIAEGETHPWIHPRGKIVDMGVVYRYVDGRRIEV